MYEGTPVGVELPNTVIREVTYTEPGLKEIQLDVQQNLPQYQQVTLYKYLCL